MSLPWTTVESVDTPDGKLALQRRGERDHMITIDGRVLMNSMTHRSESALGELAVRAAGASAAPRVLVGGLGMAYTLRALLDALPPSARVTVAELNPVIVAWCRGPIAGLTAGAVDDPRVTVVITDVAVAMREAAAAARGLDAVVIDLYVGPDGDTSERDPLYGFGACRDAFGALRPGGVFAVWAEAYHERYAKRLAAVGFQVTHERPARGNRRFVVYLATRPGASRGGPPAAPRSSRRQG